MRVSSEKRHEKSVPNRTTHEWTDEPNEAKSGLKATQII